MGGPRHEPWGQTPRKPTMGGGMPDRPPLIHFDGLSETEAYKKAKAEFKRLNGSAPIIDALGKEIVFPHDACRHICFKNEEGETDRNANRERWRSHRAAHIPWVSTILASPWEIRPNKVRGRLSYFLQFPATAAGGYPAETIYFAIVESNPGTETATFVTAFPVEERRYWNEARKVGACLYPPEKAKTKNKK